MRAEDVRRNVSIGQVLALYGHDIPQKKYLKCPFHGGEKTPSLRIYEDQNRWHCYGCGRGGTVLDWVMQSEQIGFRESIQFLADRFGLSGTVSPVTREQIQREQKARRDKERQKKQTDDRLKRLNCRAGSLRENIRKTEELLMNGTELNEIAFGYAEDIAYYRSELEKVNYEWEEVASGRVQT